ncbi:hypothetical protein GCM10009678_61960 [Actinomadura kijaniata]|uniref:Secreted protein n=1 Tax=Actinomadura namibiensis TaxID=182080 RepID=A0A7W3LT99_ACTNM|nr:hypothetical protein [Actinomadura namibiensis]MBA8953903.1 hypothetical protein [Actinomadura namibiensis]
MAGTMRVPRSRGALCGTLLVLLGLWGGLLPFVGPYLDFGFEPDRPWVYSAERLQLSVAPGAATVLGGLVVLVSANRVLAMAGAWLAALGGAWFAVGTQVARLWDVDGVGRPLGTEEGRVLGEQLAAFSALGVVVVFLAALALGRFAVVGVKEARAADGHDVHDGPADRDREADPDAGTTQPIAPAAGRYGRDAPPSPWGPVPDDRRVAGEREERPR